MFQNSVVAVYQDHDAAEKAVHHLKDAGIPTRDISVAGKDWQAREALQGYYDPGGAVFQGLDHTGEVAGAWMGGLFGLLAGFGFLLIPGVGPLVALGPLAGMLFGAGSGALVGKASGDAAFYDESAKYRAALIRGNFLVVVHTASAAEQEQAQSALSETHPLGVERFPYAVSQGDRG